MRLSTRSTYGMRALVELGLSAGRGPVSAAVIAKRQTLSVAYLEQLLHRLKKQGVVSSVRGPRGGYQLAKSPQRITMADVVQILDGSNGSHNGDAPHVARRPIPNGRNRLPSRGEARETHAQLIAQAVWRCVHERLAQTLGAVTLHDLCEEVRAEAGEPLDHRHVFHI